MAKMRAESERLELELSARKMGVYVCGLFLRFLFFLTTDLKWLSNCWESVCLQSQQRGFSASG